MEQVILRVKERFECFHKEKELFLNHPTIIEYLWNQCTIYKFEIKQLFYPSIKHFRVVRVNPSHKIQLKSNFHIMLNLFDLYADDYIKLKKIYQNNNNNNNRIHELLLNKLPCRKDLNSHQKDIFKILLQFEENNLISFVFLWNFLQKGSHDTVFHLPKINFQLNFCFDFFGFSIYKSKLNLFVILYDQREHFDSNSHDFESIHIRDLFIQFLLEKLNVHMLRLNKKLDFYSEIYKFLKKIKYTTEYIAVNPIIPNLKVLNNIQNMNHNYLKSIETFINDFNYNHIIFLKLPDIDEELFDSEEDVVLNKLIHKDINKDYQDQEFKVNKKEVIKFITEYDKIYSGINEKQEQVDNLFIELVGVNNSNNGIDISDIFNEDDNNEISDDIKERLLHQESKILKYVYNDKKVQNNIINQDVKKLLYNYKEKTVDLSKYTELKKLQGYKLLKKDNMNKLYPTETYIKYIHRSDIGKQGDIKLHVRGGILLDGGIFKEKNFKSLEDKTKWTHLQLLFSPKKKMNTKKVYERHAFYLKINSYHIFFKYFQK